MKLSYSAPRAIDCVVSVRRSGIRAIKAARLRPADATTTGLPLSVRADVFCVRYALPREVVDDVAARTGGVPLFVEEVTKPEYALHLTIQEAVPPENHFPAWSGVAARAASVAVWCSALDAEHPWSIPPSRA